MAPYTKPETVLRRCEELLSVNQPLSALASISEIFSSKRFRQTPLSSLEPIMLKFIDLCVQLRKGRTAKEGLHLYKNVAQNTSVGSVDVVIQHFIKRSRERLEEGLVKLEELEGTEVVEGDAVDKTEKVDVEDLEAIETPEGLLLSTVSEENSRDRTYREQVTPWLRGLWEAYRTALDILRNNGRLEHVYQQIATEAFQFCLKHERKTEFRRLCETLRSNLASSQKYLHQTHSINLNEPEVLQRHLDTRFSQLTTAVELELWQEAFRTAEDIHGLVGMSKKPPKSSVMASFYDKMAKVFGVGRNFLFHAAAYSKYHAIQSTTSMDEKTAETIASTVLVSALAVPVGNGLGAATESARRRGDDDSTEPAAAKGKLGRLAAIIGLSTTPTRSALLRDALSRGTLKRASKDVQELYRILEVDFHPLSITSKIEPILVRLAEAADTERYVGPLKEVVLARLFQQLAQVYDTLKLQRIIKLATFGGAAIETGAEAEALTRARVEKFVMEACKRGELEVILDHVDSTVRFANRPFELESASPSAAGLTSATDSVGMLQPSAAALLRTSLLRLANSLGSCLDCVSPSLSPISAGENARSAALAALPIESTKQRKALFKRKAAIDERRRKADETTVRLEKEEAAAKAARMIQVAEEQQARIQKLNRESEIRKAREEAEKIRASEAKKVAMALAAQAGVKIDTQNLANVDTNTIIQMGVEQIEKDKKDLASKLRTVNKRIDHTERAMRREEIPLLGQDYVEQQERDKVNHANSHKELTDSLRSQHESDLSIKKQLVKILPDYRQYREEVGARRGVDFKAAEETAKQQIEKAKRERKAQVLSARRVEQERLVEEERREREAEEQARLAQEAEERLEEERRVKQETIEEEERKFKEQSEAKNAAAKEARAKERKEAEESAAKQRAREEEAEERRRARSSGALGNFAQPRPVAVAAAETGTGNQGTWRRTESGSGTPRTTTPSGDLKPVSLAPKAGGWRDRVASQTAPSGENNARSGASRTQSPVPTSEVAPPRFVSAPSSGGGGGGSWREREAARKGGGAGPVNGTRDGDSVDPKRPLNSGSRPLGTRGDTNRNSSGRADSDKWRS